jgi:hypothetical protein
MRVVILGGLYALLSVSVIRGQSQQGKPQSCSPSCVSTDEFREMTGEKVYPKIIVDAVKFDSPVHLPDSNEEPEIISELKQHVFDRGSEGLDEVLEVRIRSAWQDQGFFKVLASGQMHVVSSDSTCEHVTITIRVNPGLQYRLGDVRFRSSNPDDRETLAFPRGELRKQIPLQEGDIFNATKIRESLDAMKRLYDSDGYINCVVTPITEVDDSARIVSLIMEVDEGKQFRVGKVEVLGLEPGKANALTSRVRQGDVFQYSLVEEFIKANIPGFLDVVSSEVPKLRKSEKDGTVDIVVDFRWLARQSSPECDARESLNPLKPVDPIYSEAMDLAKVLQGYGLTIKCVLPSKMGNAFEGQMGAALYRTNRGDFEALFLEKPATFASVKPIEARKNGFYVYSFEGWPPARGGWTSSRREYFVKHRSQMLITREEQLAVDLDTELNSL